MATAHRVLTWLAARDAWPDPERLQRLARLGFGLAAGVAFVGLLVLGRGMTFFQDEWRFVEVAGPYGTPHDWVKPHNEHWSTAAFFLYRTIFNVVGLSTYLPYLAVLLALHVAAAAGVYWLLERRNGAPVALGGAILVLGLGAGYQNLFWAFQIGFVGSTAAGLWALVALEGDDRRRHLAAAALLLVAVAGSSIGLVFGAVAGAELLADPARRRRIAWLVPVGLAYLGWYLVWGRHGVTDARNPFTAEAVADVPRFVWIGLVGAVEAASTGILGRVNAVLGALPLAELGAAILLASPVAWLARRRVSPRTIGAVAGLVVMFGLIGLVRGHLGDAQPTRSRYLYEGVVLVVLAVSGLLGDRLRPGVASLARPSTAALAAGLAALLALGLATNAVSLASGFRDWTNRSNEARAYIALLDEVPDAAFARPAAVEWNIPGPDGMRRLIDAHGSPATDAIVPGVVPRPTELDRDRALFRLVGGGFRLVGAEPTGSPEAPRIAAVEGFAEVADGCVRLAAGSGDRLRLTLQLPDGGSVRVSAAAEATGTATLHRAPLPQRPNGVELPVGPRPVTVVTPAVDAAASWLVSLDLPVTAGPLVACPFGPPGA